MAGNTLTAASTMQCPHGGTVQIVAPANTKVKAGGALVATANDTFAIVGCPSVPPCTKIQWSVIDLKVKAGPNQTLSQSSLGIANGAPPGPVVILNTQNKVSSQ
jgi:hypothetical protein